MITDKRDTLLSFYQQPGVMTDPGSHREMFEALPRDVPALVKVLQGLMLHIFWAERYGVKLSEERQAEVQIRPVKNKVPRLLEIDPRPLDQARPAELRLVGNCRDFSTTLASMLKVHGIPARARCGFGTYFMPGHYEDHWMTEYWHAGEERWVQVDAQLDSLQQETLKLQFDPLDMPRGQFAIAGDAWAMCRAGQANPDDFGIFEWHGWDFIKGNVMRDLLALNNVEVLPWDDWSIVAKPWAEFTLEEQLAFDRLAALTVAGDSAFEEVRALYEANPDYHIPPEWSA